MRIWDPACKNFESGIQVEKFGSEIRDNIPDPHHCCIKQFYFIFAVLVNKALSISAPFVSFRSVKLYKNCAHIAIHYT
jgi:hypothetical protein